MKKSICLILCMMMLMSCLAGASITSRAAEIALPENYTYPTYRSADLSDWTALERQLVQTGLGYAENYGSDALGFMLIYQGALQNPSSYGANYINTQASQVNSCVSNVLNYLNSVENEIEENKDLVYVFSQYETFYIKSLFTEALTLAKNLKAITLSSSTSISAADVYFDDLSELYGNLVYLEEVAYNGEQVDSSQPDSPGPSDLKHGDRVVIYVPAFRKALSAAKVNETSFYNKGVDITIGDGKVRGYGNTEIWTVIKNSNGTYSFTNNGQNIGLAEQYNSMNLGAVYDDWKLISLGGSLYNLQNSVRGNYMQWYNQAGNWSSYNNNNAVTNAEFQLSFYVIGEGILENNNTSDPENEVTEPEETTPSVNVPVGVVTNPVAGTAYKMGMDKGNGRVLYFTGNTESETVTHRLETSDNVADAVDVYLETTDGGYRLCFYKDGIKNYIEIEEYTNSEGRQRGNVKITTSPSCCWVYDSNTGVYVVKLPIAGKYFLGTYGTYETITASWIGYIDGAMSGSTSQFPVWFYSVENYDDEPQMTEPSVSDDIASVNEPETGVAYKFGFRQNSIDGKPYLGFAGMMSGYHYATTEEIDKMVDVYLEATDNGYHLYFMNGSTKTYLDVVPRDNNPTKVNVVMRTSGTHTIYQLNTEHKYVYTIEVGTEWYLGTYQTNSTISASKTSYISDTSTIGVTQFCAWFYEVEGREPTEPEDQIPGDLDGDCEVTNLDVQYLLWYTLFPDDYPIAGDVDFNGDGAINNGDVAYLLWYTLFPEDYPL